MKTAGKIKDAGVTLRAVILALILIPLNNLWITVIEVRWYALDGTCLPLFITPIFILFVIATPNLALRKMAPRLSLRRGELLTVYIMLVTGATLAGHDLIQNLFGTLGHASHFANDSNKYAEWFFRYLPGQLFVSESSAGSKLALDQFYKGMTYPWAWAILQYWIRPLLSWGALVMVMIGMMMCLNIIVRKQWTENEKLSFPLVQLPIAMTAEDAGPKFYANKLMWGGFSLAFAIGLLNGLHALYPSLPVLEGIKHYNLGASLTARPWSAINVGGNGFQIAAYPFAIGLAYFMPLDLSFSCWFFYIARKLWQVFGATMGWDTIGNRGFPFYEQQSSGAWLALGVIIIISSIPFLKIVWNQAWNHEQTPEEKASSTRYRKWLYCFAAAAAVLFVANSLMGKRVGLQWWVVLLAIGGFPWLVSVLEQTWRKATSQDQIEGRLYQVAFYGLILGTVFLLAFSRWIGMAAWAALIFFAIYFILSIAMTRVRAELGTPHEIYFVNPQVIMVTVLGYSALGPLNLTAMYSMYWFNRCYRCHPMPNQLEAFKMAEGTAIKIRPLVFALMLAAFVGLLASYWANLKVTYDAGAQAKCLGFKSWVGAESFDRLSQTIREQTPREWDKIGWMGVGAAMVTALTLVRGAFVGWPFHPAGYALAISYAMDYFWFAFFVSWLLKMLIVRYGGMKAHNLFVPFFLGLVLGDFCVGSMWALIGPLIGQQTYKIFI